MSTNLFTEGVKPGGLTNKTEIRILLCYLLDKIGVPVSRTQIEDVLLGEELVNYFILAESLASLQEQGLIEIENTLCMLTEKGRTVGKTLGSDIPKSVRDTAVRGVIRAQQYAAKEMAHHSEIVQSDTGRSVICSIGDNSGPLFKMELYMPDEITAKAIKTQFVNSGNDIYKLVLAALTDNRKLAEEALRKLK